MRTKHAHIRTHTYQFISIPLYIKRVRVCLYSWMCGRQQLLTVDVRYGWNPGGSADGKPIFIPLYMVLAIHYIDVIMTTMASQITSITVVYSIVFSGADKKKTSKLRVTGLCAGNSPGPVNSPHKEPVTRKIFPFDDVIMYRVQSTPDDGVEALSGRNRLTICTLRMKSISTFGNSLSSIRCIDNTISVQWWKQNTRVLNTCMWYVLWILLDIKRREREGWGEEGDTLE